MTTESDLFLGFDCSTQSLTAVFIDLQRREIVLRESVVFDVDLPEYRTRKGVLIDSNDPSVVCSPTLMWVDALDRMFERLSYRIDLGRVAAIAGSAQQHGSVYLNDRAAKILAGLRPGSPLKDQLAPIFSRDLSPTWQDTSTTTECEEIRAALGGTEAIAQLTGSDVFERFTGPQIRRFFKTERDAFENTRVFTLVSSFLCSVLAGRLAPIEPTDGAGMALMNIRELCWSSRALDATAPGLSDRLPHLVASDTVIGRPSPYFTERYGLAPSTNLLPWSGDNPSTLIGLGLVEPGMVGISLGTSDTYFACVLEPTTDPRGEGHVFGSPTGTYMTLNCFRNGSLAREAIRDRFALDWAGFSAALRVTPPGNYGALMLPFFAAEIVPRVTEPCVQRSPDLDPDDAEVNCRAVVEAQAMSMRNHADWMGSPPRSIYATGGASRNPQILQVIADVFNCPVYRSEISNGAALGAALRAADGHFKALGKPTTWAETVSGFTSPVTASQVLPRPEANALYEPFRRRYAACEADFLRATRQLIKPAES